MARTARVMSSAYGEQNDRLKITYELAKEKFDSVKGKKASHSGISVKGG